MVSLSFYFFIFSFIFHHFLSMHVEGMLPLSNRLIYLLLFRFSINSLKWNESDIKVFELCPTLCSPTLYSPRNSVQFSSVQFSSVQSLSHVQLFATPWTAALQASLSITSSWSLPKLMSIELVMPSIHLFLCWPLLLLPFNRPLHQGLFKWVSSSHQVAKVLEFQLQHQSFQWTLRTDLP